MSNMRPHTQGIAQQWALVLTSLLPPPAASSSSSSNKLPGWAVGLLVVATFCFLVLVVWLGLRHRSALQDLFFHRVRVGSGRYVEDERLPLVGHQQVQKA